MFKAFNASRLSVSRLSITILALFVCCGWVAKPAYAQSAPARGAPPFNGLCARDVAQYPDGCDAANPAAVFQSPNFFTGYAAQSGQSYVTRPPWNVAGVDYPVGYYAVEAQLLDPTIAANLPRDCTFDAVSDTVNCMGVGALTLSGYNFSLHNGVRLHIFSGYTGTITLSNNYFRNGSASDNPTFLVRIDNAAAALVDTNNVYDGNAANFPTQLAYLLADLRTGTYPTLHQYNAFINIPQKGISIPSSAVSLVQYNYCGDIEVQQYSHGECTIYAGGSTTSPTLTDSFNTYFESANPPNGGQSGGVTALQYDSAGQTGPTFSIVQVSNDVIVSNLMGGAGGSAQVSANVEMAYSTYGQIRFTQNYLDATGALHGLTVLNPAICQSPAVFSGNVNLTTGAAVTGWNANSGSGC